MKFVFLTLSLYILGLLSAGATEEVDINASAIYYVSPSGNDSNNGTSPSAPWKTLSKVNSVRFNRGDIVLFERGRQWYGQLNVRSSGVTFSAYGSGDKPVIHGWKTLSGWKNEGGGLYSITNSNLLETARVLAINGEIRRKGRFPRDEWHPITSVYRNNSITSDKLSGTPDYTGGKVCINKNSWVIDVGDITDHTNGRITYTGTSQYNPSIHHGFFIFNHVECLTEPGDWMYDGTAKKLTMYFEDNPDNYVVKVSSIEDVVRIEKSDVVIENLRIEGSNRSSVRFIGSGATNNTVQYCKIFKSGTHGIYMDDTGGFPEGITIDNCLFEDTGNDGVNTGNSRDITVTNCVFKRTWLDPASSMGGDASGSAIKNNSYRNGRYIFKGNKIYDSGASGISFRGSDVLIENNFISRYGLTRCDSGGIKSWGLGQSIEPGDVYTNRILRKNIVSNSDYAVPILKEWTHNEEGFGIYIDDWSRNVIVEDNILYDNFVGIFFHNAGDSDIKHNLVYNSRSRSITFGDDGIATGRYGEVTNINFQHNIIHTTNFILRIHNAFSKEINLGKIDNNYYIKPNEGNYVEKHQMWANFERMTLSQWQSAYGYDLKTVTSPTTSEVSALYYNNTDTPKYINVGSDRIDIEGKPIAEPNILFQPFEGMIVLEGMPYPETIPAANQEAEPEIGFNTEPETEPRLELRPEPKDLINLFPNPNPGSFRIELKLQHFDQQIEIFVFDTSGIMVFHSREIPFNEYLNKEMNLSFLPKGRYLVNAIGGNTRVGKQFIIK